MDLLEIREPESGELLAIFIPERFKYNGAIEFVTDKNSNFQVGLMNRDKNSPVKAHFHTDQIRNVPGTSEALIFRSGAALARIFCSSQRLISKVQINAGDILVFFSGGHSIEFIKPTSLIEIKQGPYSKLFDKEYFGDDSL